MKLNMFGWLARMSIASALLLDRRDRQGVRRGAPLGLGQNTTYPKNWAVAMYNSFDTIDVFGPIDVLFYLSMSKQLHLSFVAETMDPLWMRPTSPAFNKHGSRFAASTNPTHTFDKPPRDIDVLLLPGGPGMRHADLSRAAVDFVRRTYPDVKYLLTVCTGAGLAAAAGVLDGKRATTSKSSWKDVVAMGPKVKWVSPARWTVDGKVWTSSGVTSGLDLIFEFIDVVYSEDLSREIQGKMEYQRARDACDDPWAAVHGVAPTGDCRA
ncbi:hypothetical protein E4U42_004152 [Claviceps africana]|uniref:DJ-1/PfpI domain-containing protein n=1 Tax=Claviceps africana TaxID=83212 RepID=A0A8K0NH76_9HYPO|nr:hypothetical protein E4U42_004152 [Claviceps africana]